MATGQLKPIKLAENKCFETCRHLSWCYMWP